MWPHLAKKSIVKRKEKNKVADYKDWLKVMERLLKERTGRSDIEVTGGPYRGYDVAVDQAEDGHPIVDFYSVIRLDGRAANALAYAVSLIKDWDATKASQDDERRLVKPIFDRIQAMFPEYEMDYTTMDRESHYVNAERDEKGIAVSFDLWPAITEQGIAKIAGYIRECVERMSDHSIMTGLKYDKGG